MLYLSLECLPVKRYSQGVQDGSIFNKYLEIAKYMNDQPNGWRNVLQSHRPMQTEISSRDLLSRIAGLHVD